MHIVPVGLINNNHRNLLEKSFTSNEQHDNKQYASEAVLSRFMMQKLSNVSFEAKKEDIILIPSYLEELNDKLARNKIRPQDVYKYKDAVLNREFINKPRHYFREPILNYACRNKLNSLALVLIDCPGININSKDENDKSTPLINACFSENEDIVRKILAHPNLKINLQNRNKNTALHYACSRQSKNIFDMLLNYRGIDINIQNKWGNTVLIDTCDISSFDKNDESGKSWIDTYRYYSQQLLSRPEININLKNNNNDNALMAALKSKNDIIAKALLERPELVFYNTNNDGEDEFFLACKKNLVDIADYMLSKYEKIDINSKNKELDTPLIAASVRGHLEMVKKLLTLKGIDINAQNKFGRTALISACVHNNGEVVDELLEIEGIDVNATDYLGYSALGEAIYHRYHGIVEKLLQHRDIIVSEKDIEIAEKDGTERIKNMLSEHINNKERSNKS